MDPNRISEDSTHCFYRILRLHENAGLQDSTLESEDTLPDSCRRMKQAFQGAVQKVSPPWRRKVKGLDDATVTEC